MSARASEHHRSWIPASRRARKFERHNDRASLHHISENQSDLRGIKHGWYAIEDDGNLSSGPFPSFEEWVTKISQPANGTTAPKLQQGPN